MNLIIIWKISLNEENKHLRLKFWRNELPKIFEDLFTMTFLTEMISYI